MMDTAGISVLRLSMNSLDLYTEWYMCLHAFLWEGGSTYNAFQRDPLSKKDGKQQHCQ